MLNATTIIISTFVNIDFENIVRDSLGCLHFA